MIIYFTQVCGEMVSAEVVRTERRESPQEGLTIQTVYIKVDGMEAPQELWYGGRPTCKSCDAILLDSTKPHTYV